MSSYYTGNFTNVIEIEELFRQSKKNDVIVSAAFLKIFKKEEVTFFDSEIILGEEFKEKILKSNISEEEFFNTLNTEINSLNKEERTLLCEEAKILEDNAYSSSPDVVPLKTFTKWEDQ